MRQYLQKAVFLLLVLWGVVSAVFFLFQGLGDPARMVVGQTGDKATLENIRKELYLDKPVWKQYLHYLNDISPVCIHSKKEIESKKLRGFFIGGNRKLGLKIPYLRQSYQSKQDVVKVLADALPGTIVLAVAAMVIAVIIGILLGILAAVYKGSWIDRTSMIASVAGISAPSFFMAIIIAYVFGLLLQPYTGLGITGSLYETDPSTGERFLQLKNLILPAVTLGIRPLAIIAQLTRSSMLDVLSQDFIRTAYAKGLSRSRVIFRHALPNALNPVITAITGWFAELLAGSFFVEFIFGWKGLGKITVDALEKLDYPVVMGSVLLTALIFVMINLLSDLLYRWLDPRVGR